MRRRSLVAIVLVAGAALAANMSPAVAVDAILKVDLTGAQERPGPGAAGAVGHADIYIDADTSNLCVSFQWANVPGTYSGFHIHLAPPTAAGPIVIPFATPPTPSSSTFQCVNVPNKALLDNVSANPEQYYLNLHSTPNFAPGALRGQLQRA